MTAMIADAARSTSAPGGRRSAGRDASRAAAIRPRSTVNRSRNETWAGWPSVTDSAESTT